MFDFISSARHNEDWVSDLIETYGRLVQWAIYRYIDDQQTAEEAVSDVFIKLSRNSNKFQNLAPSELLPYILVITRNTRIDYQRKLERNSKVDYVVPEELDHYPSEFDLLEEIGAARIGYDIDVYIDQLDKEDQDILWYSYQEDYTDKEIAEILGIKEEAAKKRRQRAVKKIGDILKGRGAEFYCG